MAEIAAAVRPRATPSAKAPPARVEARFAIGLILPSLVVLALTTTLPVVFLVWSSLQRINPSMSFMNGFAGAANYVTMVSDTRFWNSLRLTLVYTASTVVLQVVIGLGLALAIIGVAARPMARPARRDPAHRARAGCGRNLFSAR